MNKPKYKKILSCCVVLTVCIYQLWVQPLQAQAKSGESGSLDVGRDNPFAEIANSKKTVLQALPFSQPDVEPHELPELFIETVTLKSIDAGSLEAVIKQFSSEYGSISTDQKSNSLIICDTKENLEKILAQIRGADTAAIPQPKPAEQEKEPKPELFVEAITLKFLGAKSIKTAIAGMSSDYGSISIDTKSNSLIISDTKGNLERILAEVRKADRTPQQILIEVVIVDVQLKDDTEIGINWDILSENNYHIGYEQALTTASDRLTSTAAGGFVTTGLAGEFSIISGTIRNVVHMIQQKRNVEILASPRTMMVSGQTGYIKAVEEIPYTEVTDTSAGGASALTSTEFKEVGIYLEVTATVTDEGSIFLEVDTEQNVKTSVSSTGVPVVDTRKAKTSLLLNDGQIVVIGGLRRQETTREVDQIPFLGDLPLIGALFRSTSTVINNSELIVFLSPHIYKAEPIGDDEMAKYNEITKRPMLSIPAEQEKNLLE